MAVQDEQLQSTVNESSRGVVVYSSQCLFFLLQVRALVVVVVVVAAAVVVVVVVVVVARTRHNQIVQIPSGFWILRIYDI